MQDTPLQTRSPARRASRARVPLSVVHAEALWRPRPPVGYDDEGYPFEDCKVPESTRHDDALAYFREASRAVLRNEPETMVQRNLLILFEQGNRSAAVEPDMTVSFGVGRRDRNSYKMWIEGKPPDLVMEAMSEKTWQRDVDFKPPLYLDLGVREFWRLDPIGRREQPIEGFELCGSVYKPIERASSGGYPSRVLNAELSYDRVEARLVDLRTGKHVPPTPALIDRCEELQEANAVAMARIAELEARLKR